MLSKHAALPLFFALYSTAAPSGRYADSLNTTHPAMYKPRTDAAIALSERDNNDESAPPREYAETKSEAESSTPPTYIKRHSCRNDEDGQTCDECCHYDEQEEEVEYEEEEELEEEEETVDVRREKKRPKKERRLGNAIIEHQDVPYVRFRLQDTRLEDEDVHFLQMDITSCGQNGGASWAGKELQWHSEAVAMSLAPGARIKCQTFILLPLDNEADEHETFAIGIFDNESKLVLASDPTSDGGAPRLRDSENYESVMTQHYRFICEGYDEYELDIGQHFWGRRCRIKSLSGRCLRASGYRAGATKGSIRSAPCDKRDRRQLWDLFDATEDFTPEMRKATVDTPIDEMPPIPVAWKTD